jgi:hypothetical protein
MRHPTLKWWTHISTNSSHYVQLLNDAAVLTDDLFTFNDQKAGLEQIALDAFFSLLPKIHESVRSAVMNVPSDVTNFSQDQMLINKYLSYGVVPSRLVEDELVVRTPTTVSLVNGGFLFYLEKLDLLIERVEGTNKNCLECRANWSRNVESWITKALEDVNN